MNPAYLKKLFSRFKMAETEYCSFVLRKKYEQHVLVSKEFQKSGRHFHNGVKGRLYQRLEAVPQIDGTYEIYFRNKVSYEKEGSTVVMGEALPKLQNYYDIDIATKYPSHSRFKLDEVRSLYRDYEKFCSDDIEIPWIGDKYISYWFKPLKLLTTEHFVIEDLNTDLLLKKINDINFCSIGALLGNTTVFDAVQI